MVDGFITGVWDEIKNLEIERRAKAEATQTIFPTTWEVHRGTAPNDDDNFEGDMPAFLLVDLIDTLTASGDGNLEAKAVNACVQHEIKFVNSIWNETMTGKGKIKQITRVINSFQYGQFYRNKEASQR